MTLLSWRPVNFDRWLCLAGATSRTAAVQASNLVVVVERMRHSWNRLRSDLGDLFVPSGPPGTHAHAHFHAPADPGAREWALGACAADYEMFLVYLEIALQLSTRCISVPAGLAMQNWKTLAEAAARGDPGLATDARDQILYLQKTVLYARHKGIVHPRDHLLDGEGLKPWTVQEAWLINSPDREINHYVDITDTFGRKVAAVRAHASQIKDPDGLEERLRQRIAPNTAAAGLLAHR